MTTQIVPNRTLSYHAIDLITKVTSTPVQYRKCTRGPTCHNHGREMYQNNIVASDARPPNRPSSCNYFTLVNLLANDTKQAVRHLIGVLHRL